MEEAQELAKSLGPRCFFPGETDITQEASVLSVIKKSVEKFGEIHGVVNCAGVGTASKVSQEFPFLLSGLLFLLSFFSILILVLVLLVLFE